MELSSEGLRGVGGGQCCSRARWLLLGFQVFSDSDGREALEPTRLVASIHPAL